MKKINIIKKISLSAKLVLIDVDKMPQTHKELKDWVIEKSKEKVT